MEIFLSLERDTANSWTGKVKVEIAGKDVRFTLDDPDRAIDIDLRKLKRALAALENES